MSEQELLETAIERMRLEPMTPRPLAELPTGLPGATERRLKGFTPAQVSAVRVRYGRMLAEATTPNRTAWDAAKDSEVATVAKNALAVAAVAIVSALIEAGVEAFADWAGLDVVAEDARDGLAER